jgi:hypothetical protein
MSAGMPTRSERKNGLESDRTPAGVGPASYGTEKAGAVRAPLPQRSGFGTAHRNLNKNRSTSSETPGPGAFDLAGAAVKREAGKSNSFRSGVARLGPVAPGSSVFLPSSVVDNPGAGSYGEILNPYVPDKKAPKARGYIVVATRHPPAIPRRAQSYGYKEGGDGKLNLQPPPVPTHSGVGRDHIGPGQYEPMAALDVGVAQRVKLDFGQSKQSRKLFEPTNTYENRQCDRANPAPTQYDPVKPAAAPFGAPSGANRALANPSAAFSSRVKMTHQLHAGTLQPGPGHYGGSANAGMADDPAVSGDRNPNVLQGFGSTALRRGWDNPAGVPFASCNEAHSNPGPGTYGEKRNAFAEEPAAGANVHGRPPKTTLLEVPVGFGATGDRPCMGLVERRSEVLGPGSHNSHHTTMVAQIAKKVRSRTAAFGCSAGASRFGTAKSSALKQAVGSPTGGGGGGPGPASYCGGATMAQPYGTASSLADSRRPMRQGQGAFKSQSRKFPRAAAGNEAKMGGGICIVGERNGFYSGPAPTAYTLPSSFDRATKPVLPETQLPGRGFLGSDQQFKTDWVKNDNPGPGAYGSEVVERPKREYRRQLAPPGKSFSMATRFAPAQAKSAADVEAAPGRYDVAGSMLTKSFNITMAPVTR